MTEPIRTCVACRRRAAKHELVRLVVDRGTVAPGTDRGTENQRGTVAVDPHARRPGRGAYLCRREECLARALRRGGAALQRGLRAAPRQVHVDADALAAQWASAVRTPRAPQRPGTSAHPVRETA